MFPNTLYPFKRLPVYLLLGALTCFTLALPVPAAASNADWLTCEATFGGFTELELELDGREATISAVPDGSAVVPEGFTTLYVLTSGEELVIQNAGEEPSFTVVPEGLYTIHTLVYDPETLDLSIVVPGETTGFDVNALLIQGGGDICAALDVTGAKFRFSGVTPDCDAVDGGTVALAEGGTEATTCPGDGQPDVLEFASEGASTENDFTYVITDDNNVILGLPEGDMADFEEAGEGVCRVWGLAYTGNITAEVGDNAAEVALSDECFDLSDNFITVIRDCETDCTADAGELVAVDEPCLPGTEVILRALPKVKPTIPEGFEVLYVLTEGEELVIREAGPSPRFVVDEEGLFTIHTLVYDPETLDLSIVEPGVTTGFDVNALLIQGGGTICGSLDVAGAPFEIEACGPEECPAEAGTLVPAHPDRPHGNLQTVCLDGQASVLLSAKQDDFPTKPLGFELLFVLTKGDELVIQDAASLPNFEVSETGDYRIHTLIYNPETLDLSIVEPGVTTGFDVNALLIQGGGDICGALDVAGAQFAVVQCEECEATAGTLKPLLRPCLLNGTARLLARVKERPHVPRGFRRLYVLTSGEDLVIRQVSRSPYFKVKQKGRFTIHTLVYDPETLDLSIVEPGVTTGFDVNALLIQGGGSICGALDVAGAPFDVEESCLYHLIAYPNPFSNKLTINMEALPRDLYQELGEMRLEVYDMNGARLVNEELPHGDQQRELDLTTLPSGTYMVRIVEDDEPLEVLKVTKVE